MPHPVKVLHVLHAFAPGGLENGIVNIINGSPPHIEHELCVLTRGGEFLKRLNRPVVCHEMNKQSGNDMTMMFRLRRLFEQRNIDIVHTRNWAGFDGVMACCLTTRPVLIHGEHGRDMGDPEGLKQRRNIARRVLAFRARNFVAVSKDLCSWLQAIVGIPESKITFIPNGVDTERFKPGRNMDLRRKFGIADDELAIGTIGRLDPIKNHIGLIRAVQLLAGINEKVRLVIVGDGPERRSIESSLAGFQGPVPPLLLGFRQDVDQIYRIFDMFALNSFAEGMSNTLLEAMASELPIVCTGVEEISTLLRTENPELLSVLAKAATPRARYNSMQHRPSSGGSTERTRGNLLSRIIH